MQQEIFNADARFRVAMAGRRFGKNEVQTAAAVDYALSPNSYGFGADDHADVLIWHIAPTYRQAFRHGYQKVLEKLPGAWIEDKKGSEYTPSRIELNFGPELEFLSYGNPEGLQGEGVDLITGDEWAYSDPEVWDADLRPMLLDSGGGAIFISKPLGENHFHEKYKRGASAEMPYSDGSPRQDEWYSIHATSYDNEDIPAAEIDALKTTTPESIFRQEYLADPSSGGTLLTLDMLDTEPAAVLEDLNRTEWLWRVYVDLGVETDAVKARENDTDYWACAIVAEHPRRAKAYLCDVQRTRGQAPSAAAEWIKACLNWVPTNRVRYEKVQAQAWFESHLQDKKLEPVPHTPDASKEDRIIGLSVPFSNGQVKLLDWSDAPTKNVDWSDFRTEWAGFPGGKVDQLDAVAGALDEVSFGVNATGEGMDLYGRGAR
jgi:hypothetical protein